MTQAERILNHLRAGHSITALDALYKFNCFRLSARIHDLKKKGHPIECKTVKTSTEKAVASYYII